MSPNYPISAVNYYGNVMIASGGGSGNSVAYAYSTNYGVSWNRSYTPGNTYQGGIYNWAMSKNGQIIYAATSNGGLYYSSNSASSFSYVPITNFGNTIPTYVSVNDDGSIAYISTGNQITANSGLYKYTSSNSTYTKVLSVINSFGRGCSATDSTGNTVYVINDPGSGGMNIYISADAGNSWRTVNSSSSVFQDNPIIIGTNPLYATFNSLSNSNNTKPVVTFDGLNTYTVLSQFPTFGYLNSIATSRDLSKVYIVYNSNYLLPSHY
jgi:hypothetical protein